VTEPITEKPLVDPDAVEFDGQPGISITFAEDEPQEAQAEGVVGVTDEGADAEQKSLSAEELNKQLEDARREAEVEKQRRISTQKDWQEQQKALAYYDTITAQLQQELQRRTQAQEYMAQAQPPQVEDPDELLSDGKKLVDYLGQRDQYLWNMMLASSQPFYARVAQDEATIQGLVYDAQERAFYKAEEMLKGDPDLSYQPGDLAKSWPLINDALSRSPNGQSLRLQGKAIANTYYLIERTKRQGAKRPVQQSAPPPSATPSKQAQPGGKAYPRMDPQFAMMAKNLKLNDPQAAWRAHVDKARARKAQR